METHFNGEKLTHWALIDDVTGVCLESNEGNEPSKYILGRCRWWMGVNKQTVYRCAGPARVVFSAGVGYHVTNGIRVQLQPLQPIQEGA